MTRKKNRTIVLTVVAAVFAAGLGMGIAEAKKKARKGKKGKKAEPAQIEAAPPAEKPAEAEAPISTKGNSNTVTIKFTVAGRRRRGASGRVGKSSDPGCRSICTPDPPVAAVPGHFAACFPANAGIAREIRSCP